MATKKGIYRVKNNDGNYDVIHLETSATQVIDNPDRRFTTDTEKSTWNNKANMYGNLGIDFNTKNLVINGSLTPNSNNAMNIGSDAKRFNLITSKGLKVDSIHMKDIENLLSLDGNSSVVLKNNIDKSINIETTGLGDTNISSKNNITLNANKKIDIAAANIKLNGIASIKDINVEGSAIFDGSSFAIKSNMLIINNKEKGAGVTNSQAGITIERGTQQNYHLVFDDTDDKLKAGFDNSLKVLATEEWAKSNFNKYEHPAFHPPSIIKETEEKKFVSQEEKNNWNNKANVSHLHGSNDIADASSSNNPNVLVKRDASGDFAARNITATLLGNASTASKLLKAIKINGVSFDGSSDIEIKANANEHTHPYLPLTGGTLTGELRLPNNSLSLRIGDDVLLGDSDVANHLCIQGQEDRSLGGITFGSAKDTNIYRGGANILKTDDTFNAVGGLQVNGKSVYHEGYKPTYNDVGAAPVHHDHDFIKTNDTRDQDVKPSSRGEGLYPEFKSNTIDGLADGGIYHGVLHFRPYGINGDFSGGPAHQLAFTNNGNLFIRSGEGTDAWGEWHKLYHTGNKPNASDVGARADNWVPTWNDIQNKPSTFNPAVHNHNASQINALTGYSKPSASSAISANDSLNVAIGKLEKALDGKSNEHAHPYRPNTWVPSWGEVTGKPNFSKVATSGSYNDLSDKPTLLTINDTNTSSTTVTWSAKKINDSLIAKANASHTHTSNQITGLGSAANKDAGAGAGNVPVLDGNGKLPTSVMPSIAINETFPVANQEAALKANVEVGDIVILSTPVNNVTTFICIKNSGSTFDEKFKPLMSSTDSVTKGELNAALNNKVDKVSGKQLSTNDYTTAEKNKLAGIENNANHYVHPPKHSPSEISTDGNNRFVTDAEKNTWNSKAAGNHNHDSVYSNVNHNHDARYLSTGPNSCDLRLAAGDGRGVKFWDSDDYKIYMSSTSQQIFGGRLDNTSDYNIYFKITGGTNRGFAFKNGNNIVTQIDGSGIFRTKGQMFVGSSQVYHQGFKPNASEIGAAPASHNHTTLSEVTAINMKAHQNDSASITTTIDGVQTFFDFNLSDDPGQDKWRWRFTPSGSSVFNAMVLDPTSATTANLEVSGDIYSRGNKVYSPTNKPTAADVGALTQGQADGRYVQKSNAVITNTLVLHVPAVP